jgi:hypothetical protein
VYAQYRYDSTGTRAVKLVRRQGGLCELTIYLGEFRRDLWHGSLLVRAIFADDVEWLRLICAS